MKSRSICAAVLVTAAIVMAAPAAARAAVKLSDVQAAEAVPDKGQGYVLKLYSGCIAVYGRGDDKPLFETDIRAESLRERDRVQLTSGIEADSYEEIVRLLEDYNS